MYSWREIQLRIYKERKLFNNMVTAKTDKPTGSRVMRVLPCIALPAVNENVSKKRNSRGLKSVSDCFSLSDVSTPYLAEINDFDRKEI